jgi:hypothetical protein
MGKRTGFTNFGSGVSPGGRSLAMTGYTDPHKKNPTRRQGFEKRYFQ